MTVKLHIHYRVVDNDDPELQSIETDHSENKLKLSKPYLFLQASFFLNIYTKNKSNNKEIKHILRHNEFHIHYNSLLAVSVMFHIQ